MRRLIASFALLAFAATLTFALAGCGKLTGKLAADKPPHTLVFVQGPVDTVNHLVHLYWYGTDADGYVVGYEIKLVNPEDPVAADSAWRFTTRTDSVYSIYTPAGHATPTFYARAIDDKGERDPNPAVELFKFRNHPPVISWNMVPTFPDHSDTTISTVSVSWNISDPDGNLALVNYRVWLDGNDATPDIVPGFTNYTVPSNRFLKNGLWTSGPRTLNVQAIDDGGMAGNTISTTWYVKAPVASPDYTPGHRPGRLLIVDNLPALNAGANFIDTLYTNTAARNLPTGTWNVLRLDSNQPFKTWQDLAITLSLYDAVVWYRGNENTVSTVLQSFEPGLESYLDTGGKAYLEGLFLVRGNNAEGALDQDFASRYMDVEGQFSWPITNSTDSSQAWNNGNGAVFTTAMYSDSLTTSQLPGSPIQGNGGGIRAFVVRHASDVALVGYRDTKFKGGRPGLQPITPDTTAGPPIPIAVSVPQPSGGRVILFSVPIGLSLPRNGSNSPRVLAKIFQQLGLTGQ